MPFEGNILAGHAAMSARSGDYWINAEKIGKKALSAPICPHPGQDLPALCLCRRTLWQCGNAL
jgi:hypothetical protein